MTTRDEWIQRGEKYMEKAVDAFQDEYAEYYLRYFQTQARLCLLRASLERDETERKRYAQTVIQQGIEEGIIARHYPPKDAACNGCTVTDVSLTPLYIEVADSPTIGPVGYFCAACMEELKLATKGEIGEQR